MKRVSVVMYTICIAVLLIGAGSAPANPVLELPVQGPTTEDSSVVRYCG